MVRSKAILKRPRSAFGGFRHAPDSLIVIGVISIFVSVMLPVLRRAPRLDWSHGWTLNVLKIVGVIVLGVLLTLVAMGMIGASVLGIAYVADRIANRRNRR